MASVTADLKCAVCGRVTRHAILRSGEYRDSAEKLQRIALGAKPEPGDHTDAEPLRAENRQGLSRTRTSTTVTG
ncbi:hypothetical protein [Mycolicibacterium pyrenivorans]|uniref:hypothetical protein n=1 Tax=Mycolicibacterium pyrenivorans TaxID=187102 RepID=UPI0021F3C757|nr:hypothetical protein [Mycolicibacterium pyrenivorans]MCV7150220.1 hypothetical protein [Mycolicibacterium pyrenivorans]